MDIHFLNKLFIFKKYYLLKQEIAYPLGKKKKKFCNNLFIYKLGNSYQTFQTNIAQEIPPKKPNLFEYKSLRFAQYFTAIKRVLNVEKLGTNFLINSIFLYEFKLKIDYLFHSLIKF